MDIDVLDFGYDPTQREAIPTASVRRLASVPPRNAVNPAFLPPVGQQGTQDSPGYPGSCAAWASTYGLATFAAARAGRVDPTTAAGQASPAAIYIAVLQAGGVMAATCGGSTLSSYIRMLNADNGTGTASMQAAPYTANCETLWQDYASNPPAPDPAFAPGPVSAIETSDLDSLRQVISGGSALAYGTRLYTDWRAYAGSPVPYVGNGTVIIGKDGKPAGHCMLIIGYDDDLNGTGVGAVRIQNSQGTGWGDQGCIWMAYTTFQALAQGQAIHLLPT